MTFDIGKDWSQENSINSLIEIPSENSHTAHCIRAWNGMVSILMQNEDDIAAAPFLPPQIQKIILKKIPNLTFKQIKDRQLEGSNLNYLEKAMLYGCTKEATATREKRMKQEATLLRERLFHKTTSRQKWPKNLIPGSAVEVRNKENQNAYSGKLPSTFIKQWQIYDIFMSQLVPPTNPFRSGVEANLGVVVDWKAIDQTKLFISTKFQSFYWRSTHGLIY